MQGTQQDHETHRSDDSDDEDDDETPQEDAIFGGDSGIPTFHGNSGYNEYITNDAERAKFFANRVKTIRTKAETFATCTGEEVLIVAIDENGGCHHWGTASFEKFMEDRRVQELIYKHITETPTKPQTVLNDIRVEAKHLRALLRQKMAQKQRVQIGHGNKVVYDDPRRKPTEWPETVPFSEPVDLSHEQLLHVLKCMHVKDQENSTKVPAKPLPPKAAPPGALPTGLGPIAVRCMPLNMARNLPQKRPAETILQQNPKRVMPENHQGMPAHQFSSAVHPQMHNLGNTPVPGGYTIQGLTPYTTAVPMSTISSQAPPSGAAMIQARALGMQSFNNIGVMNQFMPSAQGPRSAQGPPRELNAGAALVQTRHFNLNQTGVRPPFHLHSMASTSAEVGGLQPSSAPKAGFVSMGRTMVAPIRPTPVGRPAPNGPTVHR